MSFSIKVDKVVNILAPAADAAGRTGTYISLKNVNRLVLQYHITQGNAATILLTPQQASAVAGTGAKALTNNVPILVDLDVAASDALTRPADAKNYTTDAGVKNKTVSFLIYPEVAMDINNGFDCITAVTGASNAANITACLALLEMNYTSDVNNVTVLTD